jgi:glycine/D-amino acid oxidase-like deaminating enzyme
MRAASDAPPSVYRDDAIDPPGLSALENDRRASVAIIGGGIVGLSTALHLAEAGVHAIVLEARDIGWGASGNNGGQVNPGLKYDPDDIERIFGADLGRRMVEFAYGTTAMTFDLIRRHKIPCDARQNGTIRAAYNSAAAAGIRATAAQCLARGMPVELLDARQVESATGTDRYVLALLDRRGGDLQPLSYVRGLARAAKAAGAEIYARTQAIRLQPSGGGWRIETPAATVHAEKILIATNGFTDGLWPGLRRTIVPVFSAIAATEPLPPGLAAQIAPFRGATYENGRITVYYRVDAKNRLLMGGRGPMHSIATPSSLAYLTRYAGRLWPGLAGARWTHGWNSRLAMTKDHWPHVHEPTGSALIFLGCNGRGVALGTAMGQQLASRLVHGTAFEMAMPITSPKPIRFHGLWPLGVKSVVLYGRIRDRLGL